MASELVSLREFARRKSWNPGYVHKLKMAGRLVMDGDKVDVQASEQLLAESADPARAHLARSPAGARGAAADEEQVQHAGGGGGGGAPLTTNATFNKAKTADQVYAAKLRELEYRERVGELIDVKEAARLAFTAFRALRDAMLNIPARVQDQCAVMTDAFEIAALIEGELTAALDGFSVDRMFKEEDDEDAAD